VSETSKARRGAAAAGAARRKTRKPASAAMPAVSAPASEVDVFIARWSPGRQLGIADWDAIAPVVSAIITASKPGGEDLARKHLCALAKHASRRQQAGMAIGDSSELLSDEALAATLGVGTSTGDSSSSRRTELTYLRRVRARALPDDYGKASELVLERKGVATPYSREECAALLAWGRASSSSRADQVLAAVLLGLGAGLDGLECPSVRGSDVLRSDWGVLVQAPGTAHAKGRRLPRAVPVLAEYEERLARLALAAGKDTLTGSSVLDGKGLSVLTRIVAKSPGMPALNGARLRATWMRTLLERGASYVAMRQGGASVETGRPLGLLSEDITLEPETFVAALRQGSEAFTPGLPPYARLGAWSEA